MPFTGWENVKPGEEFSIEEISAYYGVLGPYSMLEAPSRSLWGRFPFMVRAIAKDGVEDLFEPGEKVRLFMRPTPGPNGVADYELRAFPENIFDSTETLRRFLDMAEERAIHQSDPKGNEPWTEMFCAKEYRMPYCEALLKLEPPYSDGDMLKLYRTFADQNAEVEGRCAMLSGLFRTGAERFSGFCFGLAREGLDSPDGERLFAPWDVVLLFFEFEENGDVHNVATVPLRMVNFYKPDKLKAFAESLVE
ncbi:MAG: hypothetical protein IJB29_08260 [Mailhella sp.]|nr:hypothetical protein [Mailhella sp.]